MTFVQPIAWPVGWKLESELQASCEVNSSLESAVATVSTELRESFPPNGVVGPGFLTWLND